jgi:hypothetical protein
MYGFGDLDDNTKHLWLTHVSRCVRNVLLGPGDAKEVMWRLVKKHASVHKLHMQMGLWPWSWMHWTFSRSSSSVQWRSHVVSYWFSVGGEKECARQSIVPMTCEYSTLDIIHRIIKCKVVNHLGCNIKCEYYSIEGTSHLLAWTMSSRDRLTTNKHGTMWFNTPNGLIEWTRAPDGLIVAIKRAPDHVMVHRKAIFLMASHGGWAIYMDSHGLPAIVGAS